MGSVPRGRARCSSGEAPGGAREEERKGRWRGRLGLVVAVPTTSAMRTEMPGRGLRGGQLAARGQVVVGPGDSGHQTEGREDWDDRGVLRNTLANFI